MISPQSYYLLPQTILYAYYNHNIFHFIIIHFMINQNNWKLLASKTPKSQKDSEDRKKNTSKKYEPKKMTYNEETSIITSKINNSFSKLNSSSLAHDRKENSLSRNSSIIKSRRQDQKDSFMDTNQEGGLLEKSKVQETSQQLKKKDAIKVPALASVNNEKAMLQLERLKKQFSRFKEQIFRELQRQQKLISQLISEAINNYSKKSNEDKKFSISTELQNQIKHPIYVTPKPKILSSNTMPIFKPSDEVLQVEKQNKKTDENPQIVIQEDHKKDAKYKRFFDAMDKLRNDLKDLETISEIKLISSPKNHTERLHSRHSQIKLQ